MSDNLRDLVNVDEAAAILHISKSTVYKFTQSKDLSHYRYGGRIFFARSMLEGFLKKKTVLMEGKRE